MAWGVEDINEANALLDSIVQGHQTPVTERTSDMDSSSGTAAALEAAGFNPDAVFNVVQQMCERFVNEGVGMDAVSPMMAAYCGGLMVGAVLGKGEQNGG